MRFARSEEGTEWTAGMAAALSTPFASTRPVPRPEDLDGCDERGNGN